MIILFLLILSSISYADSCEVSRTRDVLRRNLYTYLTNPSSSTLTLNQIKDLLIFYLGISPSLITVDCSSVGAYSSQPISNIVSNGDSSPNIIPTCSDGTKYGECSNTKPKYCYLGSLLNKCSTCGCPSGNSCTNDNCNPASGNITCFSNLDCGTSQFTGNYYCSNNSITRNYLNYTCINPGTISSSCPSSTSAVLLNYCNSNLNQTCVNGNAFCQTVVTNATSTCSDGTQYSQCSINKPLYCSNGTLLSKCSICGCSTGLSCNSSTESCINITITDNIAPTVLITAPVSNSKVNGSITISANASDNVGVIGVQFKLDSANLGAEDLSAPYSISWNTSNAINGAHTLTASARDAAGNTNTSLGITINVSNIAPNQIPVAIIIASPSNGSKPLNVNFNGTLSFDPDGSITSYNWSFGDGGQGVSVIVWHNYNITGLFNTILTVKDNNGAISSATKIINVT